MTQHALHFFKIGMPASSRVAEVFLSSRQRVGDICVAQIGSRNDIIGAYLRTGRYMSSEASRKYSSGLHFRNRSGLPDFGHPALNWLCRDLLELGFGLDPEAWTRWTTVGFSCGLRLASLESEHAKQLLRKVSADDFCATGIEALALNHLAQRPLTVTDELTKVRNVFMKLLTEPPAEAQRESSRINSGQQLAWWFRHSIVWGMKAGLNADSLFTGRMLAFLETLPLRQRFISDRLVHILRAGGRPRRPTLIEFFDYSYPTTPVERMTIVELAGKVLCEQTHRGQPLEIADWILCGFREGLLLSTRNASLRKRLCTEATREGRQVVQSLFAEYIGPDPTGWRSQRLVRKAMAWLEKVHPNLARPNCRASELDRIRQLFDFAFWMGLVAGVAARSPR